MDLEKVCALFNYDERYFLLYIDYLNIMGKHPIEYTLDSIEKIREYIKNPFKSYSFITWSKEMGIVPFKEDKLETVKKCKNCMYLMKEINGNDFFCGDEYTNLNDVCENHNFNPNENASILGELFNR